MAGRAEPEDHELVPLAHGPVATVLAGISETGGAYALKVFPGRFDRRTRAKLRDELGRLAALRAAAPILVAERVQDLDDGRSALRMELCSQSLPELVGSFGPLSVADALALGSALAAALAVGHRVGLVHGGVSPGNVLFRPSGEPLLSDFGLTLRRAFPRDPGPGLDFLPPETVRDGSVDERSDLYGLGAILHLALSGRSPYHGPPGEQQGERLLRVLGTPVPPLGRADLPPRLAELVSELLVKDPDGRPGDALAVAERLAELHRATASAGDQPSTPQTASAASPAAEATVTAETGRPNAVPGPPGGPLFDDFAPPDGVDTAPTSPGDLPPPRPAGEPILVFGSPEPRGWTGRKPSLMVAAGGLSLVAVAAVLLMLNRPGELAVPPAPPPVMATSASPTPARVVQLELTDPVDRGNVVELSWRSTEPLDFAVVVAEEGERAKVLLAKRATTYRVPVDPVRKYCFLIQGSDGLQVYESQPKPIRGARCVQ
ncbi:serine/threonine protein kinase [Micromonospora sp. NPDC007230]|uniref:serine/threonine protein kinase n=1 Tax=Micromonospora sp. NPDC007230 TaxID=3364237 RepID=UPI0036A2CA43